MSQPPSLPPQHLQYRQPGTQGDETVSTIIPYRNPQALIAYYIGIFSLLPILGFPMGVTAVILGVLGLKAVKRNPAAKGTAHAWIGIITGAIFGLIWLALIVIMIIAAIASGSSRGGRF